jgi:hypothetical protein
VPPQLFTQEFWDERYSGEPVWSGDPFATPGEMASVLDPAQWSVETSEPGREATFPDGWTGTIHDAVLRAVRRTGS